MTSLIVTFNTFRDTGCLIDLISKSEASSVTSSDPKLKSDLSSLWNYDLRWNDGRHSFAFKSSNKELERLAKWIQENSYWKYQQSYYNPQTAKIDKI